MHDMHFEITVDLLPLLISKLAPTIALFFQDKMEEDK